MTYNCQLVLFPLRANDLLSPAGGKPFPPVGDAESDSVSSGMSSASMSSAASMTSSVSASNPSSSNSSIASDSVSMGKH